MAREQSQYLPEDLSSSGCGTVPLCVPQEPCGTPVYNKNVCRWNSPCLQPQMLMYVLPLKPFSILSHSHLSCTPGCCKGCSHSCLGAKQSPAETTQIVRRKRETLSNHNKGKDGGEDLKARMFWSGWLNVCKTQVTTSSCGQLRKFYKNNNIRILELQRSNICTMVDQKKAIVGENLIM